MGVWPWLFLLLGLADGAPALQALPPLLLTRWKRSGFLALSLEV